MRHIWLLLGLILFIGCHAGPPLQIKANNDLICYSEDQAGPMPELSLFHSFKPSLNNKYAILVKGVQYDAEEYTIDDKYVDNDIKQLTALLTHKGYSVYLLDNESDPYNELLQQLSHMILEVADENTKLVFAYSGKGNNNGLIPRCIKINDNRIIVQSEDMLRPLDLIRMISHPGKTAMLLSACEAGIFVDEAKRQNFNGVVIAACEEGTLTTAYELYDTTAMLATFLDMYVDDPDKTIELSNLEWDSVGGWWINLQYKLFSEGNISYRPVFYRGSPFGL